MQTQGKLKRSRYSSSCFGHRHQSLQLSFLIRHAALDFSNRMYTFGNHAHLRDRKQGGYGADTWQQCPQLQKRLVTDPAAQKRLPQEIQLLDASAWWWFCFSRDMPDAHTCISSFCECVISGNPSAPPSRGWVMKNKSSSAKCIRYSN